MKSQDWRTLAANHITHRDSKIPLTYLLPPSHPLPLDSTTLLHTLDPLDRLITSHDATSLALHVAARTYTAVRVVQAYARTAAIAQQATNCLTDYFVDEAMERARWLDEEMERRGGVVGPLHGVVISVKDQANLKGHATNAGFLSLAGKNIATTDAHIVDIFRQAGAVFLVKTTLPQAIMHLETSSYLGPTLNPHNRRLTSGGSSGGEGACVAMHGSAMGIGTDIGGSIRNPAGNCGIYGFKPSCWRLPKGGLTTSMPGAEAIVSAVGPMARSVRDLDLFITTVYASYPWRRDPNVPFIPWSRVDSSGWPVDRVRTEGAPYGWAGKGGKLRIGVWRDDGVVMPVIPVRRAMDVVVERLKADERFELVDYEGYNQQEGWDIIKNLYFMDGGANIRKLAEESGEGLLPLTEWILGESRERTVHELWEITARREAFRLAYASHFRSQCVDVILCPYAPCPAPPLGTARYWSYTSIFNLVDYPAAVFPTGLRVEEGDVEEKREYRNDADEENARNYDPKISINAPLCLQLVAPRWEDERLMAALREVDAVVNGEEAK